MRQTIWTYSHILSNRSWYLYIASDIINRISMFYHQSPSFVVHSTEIMCEFFDYVIRHPSEKGSAFSSWFGPSPNLNRGFSSGFREIAEPNQYRVRGSGKLAPEPNRTEPYHHYPYLHETRTHSMGTGFCRSRSRSLLNDPGVTHGNP